MEQYLKDGLDLLKQVNVDLAKKASQEKFTLCAQALDDFEVSKMKLEKLLNQIPVNLDDPKVARRLVNRIHKVYRELWKSVSSVYVLNMNMMDDNGFGKGS